MHLEHFIEKRKVVLKESSLHACHAGIRIMKESFDPHHSEDHVYTLFEDLDILLDKENITGFDFNVLLPAICWHDTWRSTLHKTNSALKILYAYFNDARGSAILFKQYAKRSSLPSKTKKHIHYCIRQHATLRDTLNTIFGIKYKFPKTKEAILLKEVDILDSWSIHRLHKLEHLYEYGGDKLEPTVVSLGEWWFFNLLYKAKPSRLYFEHSKKEFMERKNRMIHALLNEFWDKREQFIDLKVKSNKKCEKRINKKLRKMGIVDTVP